jgi:hypothetical protein
LARDAGPMPNLRRQLAEHHKAGWPLPHRFDSNGQRVAASALTKRSRGYLGIVEGRPHLFGDEVAVRVVDRIVGAMEQLPDDSAGIVVIGLAGTSESRLCSRLSPERSQLRRVTTEVRCPTSSGLNLRRQRAAKFGHAWKLRVGYRVWRVRCTIPADDDSCGKGRKVSPLRCFSPFSPLFRLLLTRLGIISHVRTACRAAHAVAPDSNTSAEVTTAATFCISPRYLLFRTDCIFSGSRQRLQPACRCDRG